MFHEQKEEMRGPSLAVAWDELGRPLRLRTSARRTAGFLSAAASLGFRNKGISKQTASRGHYVVAVRITPQLCGNWPNEALKGECEKGWEIRDEACAAHASICFVWTLLPTRYSLHAHALPAATTATRRALKVTGSRIRMH
jgi:hypothetical protein